MRGLLAALLLVVVLVPGAGAHTLEDPSPVEVEVLADEGEDAYYWFDGYDLWNLFVREAYLPALDEEGLVFRFTLYGGFAPQHLADALHVEVALAGPGGERVVRLSTSDDREWSGNADVVALNVTPDALPFTGVTAKLQVFVSYEDLGVAPGVAVSGIRMASYAGEDLVDAAPGGMYPPGTGGRVEVPAESERLVEELVLVGPRGYLNVSASVRGENVTVQVRNAFPEQGQHAMFRVGEAEGWFVTEAGAPESNLRPGGMHNFTMRVRATPAAVSVLPVEVVSDVGGRERLWIGVNGTALRVAHVPEGLEVAPGVPVAVDAVGPGLLVAVAAVVAVGVRLRRG